jgi:hypothetical protein
MLLAFVTGCASNPQADELRRSLESAPVCCSSPMSFPFKPVAMEQRVIVALDARSPVYGFPNGKSYFGAFALPASPHASFATVASFPVIRRNALNEWYGSYFSPMLMFYDEVFQPSGRFGGAPRFMFDGNGRRFSVLRASIPRNARYLAVFTDARLANATLPVPIEFSTADTSAVTCDASGRAAGAVPDSEIGALCGLFAGVSIYAPSQSWTSYATVPYAAGGNLELWLSGPEPKRP